jgi:hypothetical protein
MAVTGEPKKEYRKSLRLRKQQFKDFIQARYGQQVAEKW